jgi:hypothetical protein
MTPIIKVALVSLACGGAAFAATWAREQRRAGATRPAALRAARSAGLLAVAGALVGILVARWWA